MIVNIEEHVLLLPVGLNHLIESNNSTKRQIKRAKCNVFHEGSDKTSCIYRVGDSRSERSFTVRGLRNAVRVVYQRLKRIKLTVRFSNEQRRDLSQGWLLNLDVKGTPPFGGWKFEVGWKQTGNERPRASSKHNGQNRLLGKVEDSYLLSGRKPNQNSSPHI